MNKSRAHIAIAMEPHMNTFLIRATVCIALLCASITPTAFADPYQYRGAFSAMASGAGAPNQHFGTQVAIDGDLAVVATVPTALQPGKVHTFERINSVWTRRPDQEIDIYGTDAVISLGLKDGYLIIGSNRPGEGNVRIYRRDLNSWTREINSFSTGAVVSAAIDGQIAVVGNISPNGIARSYRRGTTSPLWSTIQILTPSVVQAGAGFGAAVSIVAGAVAIGAPQEDITATTGTLREDAGAAYVFELTGNTWSQAARLVEADADLRNTNGFGTAVAISGADPSTPDRLLVASQRTATRYSGRVLGYTRTSGVWTLRHTTLSPEPAGTTDGFGCTMRLDGDWAVVGACESSASGNARGAVSVLRFSSTFSSLLSSTQRVDALADEAFSIGPSVAIDRAGPTVLIGNPNAEVYGNNDEGVVLLGRGITGGTITLPTRTLDLGQGLDGAAAGFVAADASLLAVAAFGESIGNQQSRGAVYLHRRDANGFYPLELKLLAPDGVTGDQFGRALAAVGDSLLVASPERGQQGLNAAGVVYAFRRNAGVWALEAQLTPATPATQSQFGRGLAFDGTTAVLCALNDTSTVYTRSSNGSWTLTQTIAHGCETPQLQGERLILNNPFADDNGAQNIGKVSTYLRSAGQWQLQNTLFGGQNNQQFGYQIASENNLLVVTSTGPSNTFPPAQLFRAGSGGTWLPETTLQPSDAGLVCYTTALSMGRIFLGCPASGDGRDAVYMFEQSGGTWSQVQKFTNPLGHATGNFGGSISAYPNGNLFIGAQSEDLSFDGQGAAFFYVEPPLLVDGFE
jgi:hypothetical protein